jgi:hypothetical protein
VTDREHSDAADRAARLRDLADDRRAHEAVADAWLAKSFTDRLLAVDLKPDASLPDELPARLAEDALYRQNSPSASGLGPEAAHGANEVYDVSEDSRSFSGTIAGANRHQFVDVRTRGDHQSYVLG